MKAGYLISLTIVVSSLASGVGAALVLWKIIGSIKTGTMDATTISISVCFIPLAISIIVALFSFRIMQPLLAKRLRIENDDRDSPAPASSRTPDKGTASKFQAVGNNEDKMRLMIENAADVICLIDTNCVFLQVNAAATRVWGYRPEELIGKNLRDYLENDSSVEKTLNAIVGAEQSIAKITF